MEEIRSQGHLSFKEYSTNYQYCTTEENRFSTQNHSASLQSLEKENKDINYKNNDDNDDNIVENQENHEKFQNNNNEYSLQKEVNQFLNLLQTSSNNHNINENFNDNINDSYDNNNESSPNLEKIYCKTQELPIIFSTEESGISENNEKIKFRIERDLVSIDNDIRKIRTIKEKTKKILQEEISLFERKCYLLEKKQSFPQNKPNSQNNTCISNNNNDNAKRISIKNIDDLPKIIKNFSSELEQVIKMLRYLFSK